MRATLNIPDELIKEVQKITGNKSKTKAITIAMKEFIRQKNIDRIISLRGKIKIDYDWEKEEEKELKTQKQREKYIAKGK